jgi:hypothetical protein
MINTENDRNKELCLYIYIYIYERNNEKRELRSKKRRTKMDTETKKDSYHVDSVYALLDMTEWKTRVNARNECELSRTQDRRFYSVNFFAINCCKCYLYSSVLVVYFKCMYQLFYHRKYETSGLFF